MAAIEELRKDVELIKERNRKVEADKAWETSLCRKAIVSILTYMVAVLFFHFARLPNPWISAIIPSIAFILSTLSLPIFKNIWLAKFHRK